jgi:acetyl esterase/lipase
VLCYPLIDPALSRPRQGRDAAPVPRGAAPAAEPRGLPALDAHVTAATPPVFLWHTAADARVLVENSLRFASALGRHGVPFALHVYPQGRHGLGLAQDDPVVGGWTALCAAWLAER